MFLASIWYYLSSLSVFVISIFIAFYIPARVVIGKQNILKPLSLFVITLILGIVLWGIQGFIFGYLHERFLSYIYLLLFTFFFVQQKYWQNDWTVYRHALQGIEKKIDYISLIIFLAGVFVQTFMYYPMGLPTKAGIIWAGGKDSVDQVWHSALISELVQRFPPQEPGMYGIPLQNYHYWFNLVTAELIRVFHLSQLPTQFLGMYPLASILLGLTAYLLVQIIYPSKLFLRWTLFLLYFSADATYWFTAAFHRGFNFHIQSLFADSTEFLFSPPFSFSIIILLAGIYFFFKKYPKFGVKSIVICSLLFGSVVGFKIYTGIPLLVSLCLLGVFDLGRKRYQTFLICILSCVISAAIFIPVNSGSGGLFFLPVAMPRIFISDQGLGLSIINVIWGIYWSHHNYFRLFEYSLILASIYFVLQFGIRIFGLIPTNRLLSQLQKEKAIFFYSYVAISAVLGLFFYQRFGGANIWQFFLGMVIFLSFLTALNLTFLAEKLPKGMSILFTLMIIFIVTPRAIVTTKEQIVLEYQSPFHGFSYDEINSYNALRMHSSSQDSILLLGQTRYTQYASIANVFIQRGLYFSGEGEYQSPTAEILKRRKEKQTILTSKNPNEITNIFHSDNIAFVYIYNTTKLSVPVQKVGKMIFRNRYATIIQTK